MAPSAVQEKSLPNVAVFTSAVVSAYSLSVGTVARQIVVVREDACELGNSNRKGSTHGGVGGARCGDRNSCRCRGRGKPSPATPDALELELKLPPVAVQVTAGPLVVAAMERVCVTVRAPRLGETVTAIGPEALMVRPDSRIVCYSRNP